MKNPKKLVRDAYASIARRSRSSCCGASSSCCGDDSSSSISRKIGYSQEEIESVPDGADLGLGCGNPVALASLVPGETVLDLGSGAGFDCFLAAAKVGEKGKVIGVDMTPEMIEKARENAQKGGYANVEFRLGEIENLPVANELVDVVISNCVINLVPDKRRVFQEAFRVLKPGGRLMISDIVLPEEIPESIRECATAYVGCISGAILRDDYLELIRLAGFKDVEVVEENLFSFDCMANDPTARAIIEDSGISQEQLEQVARSIASIRVSARK